MKDPQPKHQEVSDDTTGGGLKPSVILDKAADLITPEGMWAQRRFGSVNTGMCAAGAIMEAGGEIRGPEYAFLNRSLGRIEGCFLADWNDAKGRTQPEVIAARRKAAELARSEGQ